MSPIKIRLTISAMEDETLANKEPKTFVIPSV
jgi:hypothetical protein